LISRGGSEQELTATIGKRNNTNMAEDLLGGEPRIWKWDGPDMKNFKWEGTVVQQKRLSEWRSDFSFF
jgi:hypothetical protein